MTLNIGDKVIYLPTLEQGIVKEIQTPNLIRVVYYCNNDWKNYQNYTSILTHIKDLQYGWDNVQDSKG